MKLLKLETALLGAAVLVFSGAAVSQQGSMEADRGQQDRQRDQIYRDDQVQRERTFDRDRIQDRLEQTDRDRLQDRDRLRDPLHIQDRDRLQDRDFYGYELMTTQEREQYRNRLQNAQNDGEWARLRSQHYQAMADRARQRGVDLPAPLYGQPIMAAEERMQLRERLAAAQSEQERAQIRAEHQTRIQDRARELGVDVPEPCYGQRLMTERELAQYRKRLQAFNSQQERDQFLAQHRDRMQARAREHQIPLSDL